MGPARLVCVRFNVPHPYGDYNTVGTKGKSKKDTGVKNVFAMLENESEQKTKQSSQKQDPGKENTEPTEEAKIEVENIKQEEEEEETVKPPADLFKAIFLDSESDSDDDNDT